MHTTLVPDNRTLTNHAPFPTPEVHSCLHDSCACSEGWGFCGDRSRAYNERARWHGAVERGREGERGYVQNWARRAVSRAGCRGRQGRDGGERQVSQQGEERCMDQVGMRGDQWHVQWVALEPPLGTAAAPGRRGGVRLRDARVTEQAGRGACPGAGRPSGGGGAARNNKVLGRGTKKGALSSKRFGGGAALPPGPKREVESKCLKGWVRSGRQHTDDSASVACQCWAWPALSKQAGGGSSWGACTCLAAT